MGIRADLQNILTYQMDQIISRAVTAKERIIVLIGDSFWGKSFLLTRLFDASTSDITIFQNSGKCENLSIILESFLQELWILKHIRKKFETTSIYLDEFWVSNLDSLIEEKIGANCNNKLSIDC